MNDFEILPDDPKLTAYALDELEGEERAAFEAALRDDPAGRFAVEEIHATTAQLQHALALEQTPAPLPTRPKRIDSCAKKRKAKLLNFPEVYYVIGGLAAAGFALVVALQTPHVASQPPAKHYVEIPLTPPAQSIAVQMPVVEGDEAPAETMPTLPATNADENGAGTNKAKAFAFDIPTSGLIEQSKKIAGAGRPLNFAPDYPVDVRRRAMKVAATEVRTEKMRAEKGSTASTVGKSPVYPQDDKFVIDAQPTTTANAQPIQRPTGHGTASTLAGTRIRTELKDIASPITVVTGQFLKDIGAGNVGTPLNFAAPMALGNSLKGESYAYRPESEFLSAEENPLSTFSADVDTASYANVRRLLAAGQRPPMDAVRIEEMVNYFPYRYEGPKRERRDEGVAAPEIAPFAATMEVAEAPWATGHRLVRIGLKAREISAAERGPANLVFLIDVSGSMAEPNKLPLVKETLRLLLSRLRVDDRVAIVVYAGASGLALPSTSVAKVREIETAIAELTPSGSTNGAMGIQLAYDIAKANFVEGGINRVVLCTDGDFNVGVTGEGELVRLITEKAKSKVFLTVLGFGMGNYKDAMLQQLADAGNGNYGYVDTRREAEKLLVEQVNGTLVTVAKDVKLQVEFNPAEVASYRLIGYEKRRLKKEDFNNDKVDAGEIGAGHTVTALYEIVPVGAEEGSAGGIAGVVDPLKYTAAKNPQTKLQTSKAGHRFVTGAATASSPKERNGGVASPDFKRELLTLKVRYKEPTGDVSRKLEFPLMDGGGRFADASDDFKFAAAVAGFGMILRDSPHKGAATFANVADWAEAGAGSDPGGYRAEFAGLVKKAATLQ